MRQATSLLRRPAAIILAMALSISISVEAAAAKTASIVIDANTGKTLYSSSADSRRYPASLTKMMTLYLTFEAMRAGKIKKTTAVPYSAQAAAQPPTKLGVKAGNSVTVETAILSLVTRSANDSAYALAELLGGSEQNFARMMTTKARSLGMKGTVFRNPHGLPNTGQFTTARDMATLGIALREQFPQYYDYFSVRSFKYGSQRIANHNKLLGRVKGVDGIKTGYTRASGFNLVSSVVDGRRKIVAVVMGGTSGRSRDDEMAGLIAAYLPKASGKSGGGDLIANVRDVEPEDTSAGMEAGEELAMLPKRHDVPDAKPGYDEEAAEMGEGDTEVADEYEVKSVGVKIDAPASERFGAATPAKKALVEPKSAPKKQVAAAKQEETVDPISTSSTGSSAPSGWSIQVASSPSKQEAENALRAVSAKAGSAVASASAYTVTFDKDGTTYFRARFGGFDSQKAATKACGALKKQKLACYATQ